MNLEEIKREFLNASYKKYQAIQVFNWINKGITCFDDMTDISKELREEFKLKYTIPNTIIERKLISKIDETTKYLFKLHDSEFIESVLIKHHLKRVYSYFIKVATI